MLQEEKNYTKKNVGELKLIERITLKEDLNLSGSEISINQIPAGKFVPFVHSHKRNEEVYIILKGKGIFYVDGEEFAIKEGTVVKVDPQGERCIKANSEDSIQFICVQADQNSLIQCTSEDGKIAETKPPWN